MKTQTPFTLLLMLFIVSLAPAQEPSARRAINLREGDIAALPFSEGVLVGNTLYLGGRIGLEPGTTTVPKELDREVRLMLDGFKDVLAKADMTMDNLVTVTVYCPDLSLYKQFNDIYKTYFTKNFPARAFIGSGPLLFGGHFEMQAIAVR